MRSSEPSNPEDAKERPFGTVDEAQPSPPAELDRAQRDVIVQILSERAALAGALLPVLHGIQDHLGFVPPAAVPLIAETLNVSRADVHGVLTFYHDFRSQPPGRRIVRVCRAEACQSMGANALAAHAEQRLGVSFHQTRADGAVTLLPVYCLGNCACAPAITVDGELHGRVTPERFDELCGEGA